MWRRLRGSASCSDRENQFSFVFSCACRGCGGSLLGVHEELGLVGVESLLGLAGLSLGRHRRCRCLGLASMPFGRDWGCRCLDINIISTVLRQVGTCRGHDVDVAGARRRISTRQLRLEAPHHRGARRGAAGARGGRDGRVQGRESADEARPRRGAVPLGRRREGRMDRPVVQLANNTACSSPAGQLPLLQTRAAGRQRTVARTFRHEDRDHAHHDDDHTAEVEAHSPVWQAAEVQEHNRAGHAARDDHGALVDRDHEQGLVLLQPDRHVDHIRQREESGAHQ
mmetsp:Transcript_51992/g.132041  ORF Transcript_51992/g.132041 Transcript_51992/m.132041 type:complete len:283 (+) Transcript_51992:149-997(+)